MSNADCPGAASPIASVDLRRCAVSPEALDLPVNGHRLLVSAGNLAKSGTGVIPLRRDAVAELPAKLGQVVRVSSRRPGRWQTGED